MIGLQSGFIPGDRYGSQIGPVGYPKVVKKMVSFFLPFFSLYHFINYRTLADPPKVQQNL